MKMAKNIGIDVPEPKEVCEDRHCPFHGDARLRGNVFVGTVVASKIKKTATVEKKWRHYIPKYERFEERRSRLRVHNPLCIDAREGERVLIMESRPISKTKKFVIVQKLEVDKK
jgi:small subunit ribosomal protein S17